MVCNGITFENLEQTFVVRVRFILLSFGWPVFVLDKRDNRRLGPRRRPFKGLSPLKNCILDFNNQKNATQLHSKLFSQNNQISFLGISKSHRFALKSKEIPVNHAKLK